MHGLIIICNLGVSTKILYPEAVGTKDFGAGSISIESESVSNIEYLILTHSNIGFGFLDLVQR